MRSDDRLFQSTRELIEGHLGEFLDSMPDGIIITDTAGKIVLVNSQAEKLFGYEQGDLVSREIETLVPERFRQDHVSYRDSYIDHPHARPMGKTGRLLGVRRDGSEFPVEVSLSPMHTENAVLICADVRDATHRMQVEDALRASEEQVRLLLDSTAEAIYGVDLDGNCTFCNQACVVTLGYRHIDELLGKNMHDLMHHSHPDGSEYPRHECRIYAAFHEGKPTHVDDEVFWKADGTSFPAEYRSIPIRHDGQLVGSVVTFLDITERKRTAEALHNQQVKLTHAARLTTLGEMATGLAHELNQPLAAMSAFAEGALMRIDRGKLDRTETMSVLSRIAEDAQRAGDIIRRLRHLVQRHEGQRQPVDVNDLASEIYKFVEAEVKQENISVQLKLGENLPKVEADSIEIQQVLLNLIRNACDALAESDASDRRIMISSYVRDPGRVEVVVEDSGPGITPNMAEQVFEPFYTSKADGLGIGLGICQSIIESHRGKIWLEDSSIGGAGIHIDLPACQSED